MTANSLTDPFAELEIALLPSAQGLYTLEFPLTQPGSDAESRLGDKPGLGSQPVIAAIDAEALRALLPDSRLYGQELTRQIFASPRGDCFR